MSAFDRLRLYGFTVQQARALALAGYDVVFVPAAAVLGAAS